MIYLVRHAQPRGYERRPFLGQSDPSLTPEGRVQAAELALRFPGVKTVWSSDLRRAIYTARAVAPDVRTDPRLRELDFGLWTGRTWEEIADRWPEEWRAWHEDPENVAPPGGETLSRLRQRATAALQDLPPGSIAVTHGGVIRALLPGTRAAHAEVFEWGG